MPSTIKNRIIVNTVPHSGTHLVATVLELVEFKHAKTFDWNSLSFKKVGINWRTSLLPENANINDSDRKFPVSVASPRLVRVEIIESILKKIQNNKYLLSHIPHSNMFEEILNKYNYKGITIIRDPRDMCLSMLNHIEARPHHLANKYLFENLQTRHERIKAILDGFSINNEQGERDFGKVERMYNSMMTWENAENFILLKFEDLVGPKGGGSVQRQHGSIQKILTLLGDQSNNVAWIAENAFGKSGTFRKGQLGRWKTEMSLYERKLFKAHDEFICSLGYDQTL